MKFSNAFLRTSSVLLFLFLVLTAARVDLQSNYRNNPSGATETEETELPNTTIIQPLEAVKTYQSELAYLSFNFTSPMYIKEVVPPTGNAFILLSQDKIESDEFQNGIQITYSSGSMDKGGCVSDNTIELEVLGERTTACEWENALSGGYPYNVSNQVEYAYHLTAVEGKETLEKLKKVLTTEIAYTTSDDAEGEELPVSESRNWVLKRKSGPSEVSIVSVTEWQLENNVVVKDGYLYALTSTYKQDYYSIVRVELSSGKLTLLREFKALNLVVDSVSDLLVDGTNIYYTEIVQPTGAYSADKYTINVYKQDLRNPGKEVKIASVKNDIIYGSGWLKKMNGDLLLSVSGGDACYGAEAIYSLDDQKRAATFIGKYESSCEMSYEILTITTDSIYLLRRITTDKEVDGEYQSQTDFEILQATITKPNSYKSLLTQKEFPQSENYVFTFDESTYKIDIIAADSNPFGFEYDPKTDILTDIPRAKIPSRSLDTNVSVQEKASKGLPSNYYWDLNQ